MPQFERAGVSLYYEEYGSGYPLLLFAPGGMRSSVEFWHRSPFDPTREFASGFRVIAMDQRNAGRSRAPISAADGWETYAGDHAALLEHLGISKCHVMGGCIGSSYCFGLIKARPDLVSAAVLQNPIGLHQNRDAFYEMFDGWATELKRNRTEIQDSALALFRENMYAGDFVFSVSRDFVRQCTAPAIVLQGSDLYHPTPISEEIVRLNPQISMIKDWKTPDVVADAVAQVRQFLERHRA